MKTRIPVAVMALLASCLLTGCLVPERFEARLQVQPDGTYTYRYDGSAVHGMAAEMLGKKGAVPPEDEVTLQRDAVPLAKMPGVRSVVYRGQGRYDLALEQTLKPGERADPLQIARVTRGEDGVYAITSAITRPKDRDKLKTLPVQVQGSVKVLLPAEATVLEHNADSVPSAADPAYRWAITALDAEPRIRFTLGR